LSDFVVPPEVVVFVLPVPAVLDVVLVVEDLEVTVLEFVVELSFVFGCAAPAATLVPPLTGLGLDVAFDTDDAFTPLLVFVLAIVFFVGVIFSTAFLAFGFSAEPPVSLPVAVPPATAAVGEDEATVVVAVTSEVEPLVIVFVFVLVIAATPSA